MAVVSPSAQEIGGLMRVSVMIDVMFRRLLDQLYCPALGAMWESALIA